MFDDDYVLGLEADVAELKDENALLKETADSLQKQLDEKEATIKEVYDVVLESYVALSSVMEGLSVTLTRTGKGL